MLEKDKYDLNYIQHNINKFEELNTIFNNFLQISDKIIHKLSLGYIDKIFIQHLNEKDRFKNIKTIEISVSQFNKFIKLEIIFSNVKELYFHINKSLKKYNISNINVLFPNITILNLYIYQNIHLIDIFNAIKKSNIIDLTIIFSLYDKYNYSKSKTLIILDNIINLRIDIDKNYCFINELFLELFISFQFPNLQTYYLTFNMNKYENNKRISKGLNNDYNNISSFIIDILLFKYKFSFQSFFNTYK
jgi:hypothetical protein